MAKKFSNYQELYDTVFNPVGAFIKQNQHGGGGRTHETPLTDISTNDIMDQYGSTGGYSSGGGAGMIDISNILKSYEQGAQTQRDIAKQTYNTKREDLLTSLKRFQEQNAKDVANQQKSYLSNQASLESAIAQADRQNRISAAARGLGGSGLQQLAQLQNLLSQGQTISNMATENQGAMDKLRTLMSNMQEDTKTAEARALADYNNTLNSIASNLAANKANIEYQAREAAANRARSASSQAAAYAQANESRAKKFSQEVLASQETLQNALSKLKAAGNNKKAIANLVNPYTGQAYGIKDAATIRDYLLDTAISNARSAMYDADIGANSAISNNYINNLRALYNNYR